MADNIFCSQCGSSNPSTSTYCQQCGKAMTASGAMAPVAATAPAMAPAAPLPVMAQSPNLYGGFWIRVLAVLIDSILINIVVWPIVLLIGGAGAAGLSNTEDPSAAIAIALSMF